MSSFGPAPIPPLAPGAVQASIIAQVAQAPRVRDKGKPQEATPFRQIVRDEVRLSDPQAAEPIDPKPDAAEEWKHRRKGGRGHDPRFTPPPSPATEPGEGHLDISA
ncbi:MAG: hypothetical protein RI967_172 [Planctomycetota bacterium]